jgi:TolA-binding protein
MNRNRCIPLSLRVFSGLTAGLLLAGAARGQAQADADKKIDSEIKFASGLIALGLPDYADRVLNRLVSDQPAAKARAAAVRIQVKTARGQFAEAEKLIAGMPANNTETLGMKLALGDAYYVWGKLAKAKEVYDSFFTLFTNGPPPELARLYAESAYKYAQMLMNKGDEKGALQAYRYVLLGKPESDIERVIQTEMAELCLKLGAETAGAERQAYFKEAKKLADAVQWKGVDQFFGRTVVMLAHIQLVDGRTNEARKIIKDFLPMLKEIDDYLRQEKMSLKNSPMAECRYLLGTLAEAEGRRLIQDKAKEAEALAQFEEALSHLYTVFLKYTSSNWAPDAGKRADALVSFLETKGRKVKRPTMDMGPIIEAQLKEAGILFQEGNYREAAEKYIEILTSFPASPSTMPCLAALGRCYVKQNDELYAKVVCRYLAERFSRNRELMTDGGNALLGIAAAYEEENKFEKAAEVFQLFFTCFPAHDKAPLVLFRLADARMRKEQYGEALDCYQRLTADYPKARLYPDALSRLAFCQSALGDHTNAIKSLTAYLAELQAGPEKIAATQRLADAYRQADQTVNAINEYARLVKYLAEESAKYSPTTDDAARNRKALERAMFWKPYSYSRLKKPEDKVALYQSKAIEDYREFLKEFPKSELAPSALSGLGTLLFLQNQPAEAGRIYERLTKEFPDSEQAQNVLFAQGQSLLDIGQTEKAIQVFEKMFGNTKAYTPVQFIQVGRVMLDAGQFETARRAYTQARTGPERALWEISSVGLAKALMGQHKFAEAIAPIEELLAKYTNTGFMVEGNLLLSRAYAEKGKNEVDQARREPCFVKALQAMIAVRQFAVDSEMLTRADVELAAIQLLMGKKDEALASYQRIFLLGNANDVKVRPHMEKAFENSVPLLIEKEKWNDVIDNCEAYLKAFPQGGLVSQAREWRDFAKVKASR